MFCVKCGKQNPDVGKFCTGCGAALRPVEKETVPEPVVAPVVQPVAVEDTAIPAPVVQTSLADETAAPVPVVRPPVPAPIAVEVPPMQPIQPVQPAQPAYPAYGNGPELPRKKKKSVLKTLIILFAVLIPLAVVAFIGVGHVLDVQAVREVEPMIGDYLNARYNMDGKDYIKLFSDDTVEYVMDQKGIASEQALIEAVESTLESGRPFEDGDIEFFYEVVAVEQIEDKELEHIQDECDEMDVKVTAAKAVWYICTVECEGEQEHYSQEIIFISDGDEWYIHPSGLNVYSYW